MNTKPSLTFFNTETRKKEPFHPINEGKVTLYTCGPTVYNFAHIGNFRTYVFEDLLRRSLQFFGFQVKQVMNLTDVDDKTIRGATEKGISLDAYTEPFKQAFFADLKILNIETVEHYPAATEYIAEMIEVIQSLVEKGAAYLGKDGSVYYRIRSFERYGCLSHLNLDELQVGASDRVAADEYDKDNASDFVLWKHYDSQRDGVIFWESPFGKGRPGWHLECSVMAMQLLGKTIDIHVGGVDNIFPHHENEIAQSEAYSGKRFVNTWLHAEHLIVENKKMSKSLGNFFTLRDLLNKGFSGCQVRMMLLQTHYKTQLNFTFEELDAVKQTLQRLQDFIFRVQSIPEGEGSGLVAVVCEKALEKFSLGLADDLNISVSLAAIFDFVREVNVLIDQEKVGASESQAILSLMERFNTVLGVLSFDQADEQIPNELSEALEKRIQARKDKDWALADSLRDYIQSQGYVIEDSSKGARLKKVSV